MRQTRNHLRQIGLMTIGLEGIIIMNVTIESSLKINTNKRHQTATLNFQLKIIGVGWVVTLVKILIGKILIQN